MTRKHKRSEKPQEPTETRDEAPVEDTASEEQPASEAPSADLDALKTRAKERDEFLDLLQRTRAEFSNYRKRVERDRVEWADRAIGEFVLGLLPVLDDFDRALAHADASAEDFEGFLKGVRLVEDKIYDVLKAAGVTPFVPTGVPFDPVEHDALIVEQTDEMPDGTINEVFLKGYHMGARVLRPAQVKVVRNAKTPSAPEDASNDAEADGGEGGDNDADV